MIPLIGKDSTQQKLLPYITELFSDENSDVRIGVARAAAKYILVSGPEAFGALGAHLKNAIQDNKWRVRVAVMEGVIDLALFFQVFE
jgi:HEAT repeat protein